MTSTKETQKEKKYDKREKRKTKKGTENKKKYTNKQNKKDEKERKNKYIEKIIIKIRLLSSITPTVRKEINEENTWYKIKTLRKILFFLF